MLPNGCCAPVMVRNMLLTPDSVEELAETVRAEAMRDEHLSLLGAGTRLHAGNTPAAGAHTLRLTALDRLLEHVPADMTVAVEAGMPLGRLQALLREHGQWLPWEPPAPPEATVGGLLATAASGLLRYGYGTPRDWLLGMRVVLGDGRLVKSGGRVVKNVAGYDTHKLQIGAFGTLGVIAEATFKVFPLPETSASVLAPAADLALAQRYAELLRAAPLAPVSVVVLADTDLAPAYRVAARYVGATAAVARQVVLATTSVPAEPLTGDHEQAFWAHAAAFAQPQPGEQAVILRAAARPAELAAVLALLQHAGSAATTIGYSGVGVAYARWFAPEPATLAASISSLRRELAAHGGYAVVEYAPAAAPALDRWGTPPNGPLMRALRQQWNPREIVNRDRYM